VCASGSSRIDCVCDRGVKRSHGGPASSAAKETRALFAHALSELKAEHGLSFSELTCATEARDPTGRGLSAGHLSRLCNAIDLPSPATMALLAESPRYFAEYRLAEARQNLTMRMGMRRFTRLTNGFSKKIENLAHAVSLHYMYYNFGRTHQTLQMTPAMAAEVADHKWSLKEIAGLLD
jgi:hypothetical protein